MKNKRGELHGITVNLSLSPDAIEIRAAAVYRYKRRNARWSVLDCRRNRICCTQHIPAQVICRRLELVAQITQPALGHLTEESTEKKKRPRAYP